VNGRFWAGELGLAQIDHSGADDRGRAVGLACQPASVADEVAEDAGVLGRRRRAARPRDRLQVLHDGCQFVLGPGAVDQSQTLVEFAGRDTAIGCGGQQHGRGPLAVGIGCAPCRAGQNGAARSGIAGRGLSRLRDVHGSSSPR